MTIAKWEAYNGNGENNMASTATRTSVLAIQDKTVTGVAIDPESRAITECDELRIPFKTIVHRDPVDQERDAVFDKQGLLDFADCIWGGIRRGRKLK